MLTRVHDNEPRPPWENLPERTPAPGSVVDFESPHRPKETKMEPLRIRMKRTEVGSPDGVRAVTYREGEEYIFVTPSEMSLGRVFVEEMGAAERIGETSTEAATHEAAERLAAPETKQLPKPRRKRGRKR